MSANLVKALSFRMTFPTRHFNRGQRVWVVRLIGNQAAEVTGKYRGFGRYITAWVKWESPNFENPNIEGFEVESDFANRHNLQRSEEK